MVLGDALENSVEFFPNISRRSGLKELNAENSTKNITMKAYQFTILPQFFPYIGKLSKCTKRSRAAAARILFIRLGAVGALLAATFQCLATMGLVSANREVIALTYASTAPPPPPPADAMTNTATGPFVASAASSNPYQSLVVNSYASIDSDIEVTTNFVFASLTGDSGWAWDTVNTFPSLLYTGPYATLSLRFSFTSTITYTLRVFSSVFDSTDTPFPNGGNASFVLHQSLTDHVNFRVSHDSNGPVVFRGTLGPGADGELGCSVVATPGAANSPNFIHAVTGQLNANGEVIVNNFEFVATESAISEPPTLGYALAGQNLVLSWPVYAHTFDLQETTDIGPGAVWTPVLTGPTIDGDRLEVSVSTAKGKKFYRLKGSL
jgi:hypothetical protein